MVVAQLTGLLFSYATRLNLLLAYCFVAGAFLYIVCKKASAGSLQRVFASVLVVVGNCVVLNLFDVWSEVVTACAVFFLFVWLSTFKVMTLIACQMQQGARMLEDETLLSQIAGLCTNRGPLCQPLDFLQFLAVLWLPITPQLVVQSTSSPPAPVFLAYSAEEGGVESNGSCW